MLLSIVSERSRGQSCGRRRNIKEEKQAWRRTSCRIASRYRFFGSATIQKYRPDPVGRPHLILTVSRASFPCNTYGTSSMLQVDRLSKRYGERVAVNAISFSIAQGETVGLLGPNGAGKTTAIAMISGISRPDVGEVSLGGVSLAQDPNALKRRVGLVPQDLALYEELSAWANLQLFGGLYGLGAADLQPRAKAALALVGLADRSTDRVKTFSGGMKRRLNIAGALLHEPDLILLDEPTVGVDPQSRNAIFDNLEELKRRGKTLLYTTHYMEEAERLCDRVLILDHGQILANDTVAHFKQQYTNLEGAFMQLTGRALRDGAEA